MGLGTIVAFNAILFLSMTTMLLVYQMVKPESTIMSWWNNYRMSYVSQLRYVKTRVNPNAWAWIHLIVLLSWIVYSVLMSSVVGLLLLPVVAIAPLTHCSRLKSLFQEKIGMQVGPWALLLSTNLGASPSIYEALEKSMPRLHYPIKEETGRLVRDVSLGLSLQDALTESGKRVSHPVYSAVLSTLKIGGQSGGTLPTILREISENIQEMQRLEGVVRVKTADGKTQSYVLGVFPFLMAGAMQSFDHAYYKNFTSSTFGILLFSVAMVLWIGSIIVANRILKVDL